MGKKNWAKHDAERDRLFQLVPKELPEDLTDYVINVALDNEQYIYYDRKKKYAYCTRCDRVIDARFMKYRGATHNSETKCPQGIEAEKAAALKMAADLEKKLQTAGSATVEQIVFGHLFTEFQEQYNKLLSSIGRMDPEVAPKYRGAMAKFIGMMTDRLEVKS